MGEDVSGVYLGDSGGVDLLIARYEDGGFGTVVIRDRENSVVTVTGSREWVWERPLDRGKLGTGHYVILLMRLDLCHAAVP